MGGESIEELLEAARAEYVATLPDKVAALASLVERDAWVEARRAAHRLRGSAATYDCLALAESLEAIEDALLDCSDAPDATTVARIMELLAEARRLAQRALDE